MIPQDRAQELRSLKEIANSLKAIAKSLDSINKILFFNELPAEKKEIIFEGDDLK